MNRNVVVREMDRADPAVVKGLGVAGTATVHEAIGRVGFAGADLRPIQQDVRIAGSASFNSSRRRRTSPQRSSGTCRRVSRIACSLMATDMANPLDHSAGRRLCGTS